MPPNSRRRERTGSRTVMTSSSPRGRSLGSLVIMRSTTRATACGTCGSRLRTGVARSVTCLEMLPTRDDVVRQRLHGEGAVEGAIGVAVDRAHFVTAKEANERAVLQACACQDISSGAVLRGWARPRPGRSHQATGDYSPPHACGENTCLLREVRPACWLPAFGVAPAAGWRGCRRWWRWWWWRGLQGWRGGFPWLGRLGAPS